MILGKNVLVVAADYGESQVALGLCEKLLEAGASVQNLLGNGQDPSPITIDMVQRGVALSDIVVVLTSDNTAIEVAAASFAVMNSKKLVFVSLGFRSWEKEDFTPFRKHVSLVVVSDQIEAEKATDLYPNANVLVSGDPLCEGMASPSLSREEVRAKLAITKNQALVLISGEKEININIPLGVTVLEALRLMSAPKLFRVIFTIHPGHALLPKQVTANIPELIEFYWSQLEGYIPDVEVTSSCKANPFGIGTPDMVAGADIVVGTNSTEQVRAAYQHIPAVGLPFFAAWRGVTLPRVNHGWWHYYDKGVIAPVYDLSPVTLCERFSQLLNSSSGEAIRMRDAQKLRLPAYPVGTAYELIGEALFAL